MCNFMKKKWRSRNRLSMLLVSAFLLFFSPVGLVRAGSLSVTGTDTWAYPRSRIAEPISPLGSVITNFTNYSAATFPSVTGTFYVTQTGLYTASLQSTIANGIYMAQGFFVPSATTTPSMPLSDVIAFIQNGNLSTLSNIQLQAGTRYSYIMVFNGSASASFTLTLTGLGDIYHLGLDEAQFLTHLPSAVRDILNTSSQLINQRQDLRRGMASGDDFLAMARSG
jgi:hypothetical protein